MPGRVVFAFFLQPLVAALIAFALFPVIQYMLPGGGSPVDSMDAAVSVAAGAALAAVFVVAFGAVPLFVWMARRGPITLRKTLLAGAALGNLPGVLVAVSLSLNPAAAASGPAGPAGLARAILLPSIVGTACAAVFWLMTRARISRSWPSNQPS